MTAATAYGVAPPRTATGTATQRITDALSARGKVARTGRSWSSRCPAHEDHSPSLSVTQIEGQALVHCHAGCQTTDVMGALNLTMADLYDERTGARYDYGARVVHRSPDKKFRQTGDTASRPTLYRLGKVTEAVKAGTTVYLVEGEKDVHALESLGVVATTAPMGASNWSKVDTGPLKGADVVVVPDRDQAGERWTRDVLASLAGLAASVRVGTPKDGKDAADHVAAGHGLRELDPREPPPTDSVGRRARITWASDIKIRPVVWAWTDDGEGRIPTGSLSIAAGREGTGKSTFGIWLAAQITRGTLPGNLYGTPRRVLYVAVEDTWEHTIAPRLAAAGADMTMVGRFDVINFEGEEVTLALPHDNALLEQAITEHAVALVTMDPLMSLIGEGIDTHVTRSVRRALDPLARIADRTACLMLGIAHFNKGNAVDPSSLITGSGAFKDVPRSVFGFVRDSDTDDGSRVMSQTKNSLGRDDLPSLRYLIEDAEVPTDEGPAHVGRLAWRGVSERTAGDILRDANTAPEDRDERTDAAAWLRSFLDDQDGSADAKTVQDAGKAAGFSWDSLKRAKGRVAVRSRKGAGGWVWTTEPHLPDQQGSKGATRDGAIDPCPLAPLAAEGESPDTCRSCEQVLFLHSDGRDQCERCRLAEGRAA